MREHGLGEGRRRTELRGVRRLLRMGLGLGFGLSLSLGLGLGRSGWAQVAPGAATGTVRGSAVCSDTRGPARLVSVSLVPVPPKEAKGKSGSESVTVHTVTTDLQGAFVLRGVRPGSYYVEVMDPGYQLPVFTAEEMRHPTPATTRRMEELLVPVSVAANRESVVEVTAVRGGGVTGRVLFDDGTPYGGATVELWRKGAKGWEGMPGNWMNAAVGMSVSGTVTAQADDRGEYRFAGLPAGEYLVSVPLQLSQTLAQQNSDGGRGWFPLPASKMEVYAPNTVRQKDAKEVTLKEGQEVDGEEIEVPLSTLHPVNGSLAEAGSGVMVNSGHVALLWADDKTLMMDVDVSPDDNRFHLSFVPEGSYVVRVTDAALVSRTELPNPPGTTPPTHTETKTLQQFGDAEQPLVVEGDVSGLVVAVPPRQGGAK